jgi:hypothetical protein
MTPKHSNLKQSSNQISLRSVPPDLSRAQQLACEVYQTCCTQCLPQDFSSIIKELGQKSTIASLVLSGPASLAQDAILSGIRAYTARGAGLYSASSTKMNVIISLELLSPYLEEERIAALRAQGHSKAMVLVKTSVS